MTKDLGIGIDGLGLLAEVKRYLAAVDAFRAAGREPYWLPEPVSADIPPARPRSRRVSNGLQGRTP
jgi:hypothetical protein